MFAMQAAADHHQHADSEAAATRAAAVPPRCFPLHAVVAGSPLHGPEGRAFMHSCDRRIDVHGSLRGTVMTAPMMVARWIDSQYYFFTVDNATYGSGSKTTQHVVGGCAIMPGNQSERRPGLPVQSVRDENGRPFHEPQRLLVLLQAPLEKVTGVIDTHAQVAGLYDNEWLMLTVLDPDTGHCYRYQPGGYRYSEAVAMAA